MQHSILAVEVWFGPGKVNLLVAPVTPRAKAFLLILRSKSYTRLFPVKLVISSYNLITLSSTRNLERTFSPLFPLLPAVVSVRESFRGKLAYSIGYSEVSASSPKASAAQSAPSCYSCYAGYSPKPKLSWGYWESGWVWASGGTLADSISSKSTPPKPPGCWVVYFTDADGPLSISSMSIRPEDTTY